jgi:tetratricopeptide (TPR) repeat protein
VDAALLEERGRDLLPWEIEAGAYFAAQEGDGYSAMKMYEALLAQGNPPKGAQANYALVLAGTGQYQKAAAYCRRTLDTLTDPLERADFAFLLAQLQIENHADGEAIRSLEYSLMLNPDHGQARVLLKKLRGP